MGAHNTTVISNQGQWWRVSRREMVSWPAPGGGSGVWPDMSDTGTDEPGMGYGRKSLARVTWESGPRDQES